MKLTYCLVAIGIFLTIPVLVRAADSADASAAKIPASTHSATPPPRPVSHPPTKDEMAAINKAYADAMKTDPGLAAEQADLHTKILDLLAQQKVIDQRVIAAVIKADPNVAPILAAHPDIHPHQNVAAASPKK